MIDEQAAFIAASIADPGREPRNPDQLRYHEPPANMVDAFAADSDADAPPPAL